MTSGVKANARGRAADALELDLDIVGADRVTAEAAQLSGAAASPNSQADARGELVSSNGASRALEQGS
jgi:hypothetical protein